MRKADIAGALFDRVGISRKESGEMIETMLAVIKETLRKGETVKISGFGNFVVRKKRERMGRNPKTGEAIAVTPRKVVSFKASPEFKQRVGAARGATGPNE